MNILQNSLLRFLIIISLFLPPHLYHLTNIYKFHLTITLLYQKIKNIQYIFLGTLYIFNKGCDFYSQPLSLVNPQVLLLVHVVFVQLVLQFAHTDLPEF